jgi:hypothetical protein
MQGSAEAEERLAILQCDLGVVTGDLIACARYRIYDLRAKADKVQRTHVLFVIHLTHQVSGSFVGFQGDPWVSYHVDDLNTSTENTVSASEAMGLSLSELFRGPRVPPGNASEARESENENVSEADSEEGESESEDSLAESENEDSGSASEAGDNEGESGSEQNVDVVERDVDLEGKFLIKPLI